MISDMYVFHIDANSAFLSWNAAYRVSVLGEKTDLRTIPSIVGGDQEKRHGIVLAKSVPAKKGADLPHPKIIYSCNNPFPESDC